MAARGNGGIVGIVQHGVHGHKIDDGNGYALHTLGRQGNNIRPFPICVTHTDSVTRERVLVFNEKIRKRYIPCMADLELHVLRAILIKDSDREIGVFVCADAVDQRDILSARVFSVGYVCLEQQRKEQDHRDDLHCECWITNCAFRQNASAMVLKNKKRMEITPRSDERSSGRCEMGLFFTVATVPGPTSRPSRSERKSCYPFEILYLM